MFQQPATPLQLTPGETLLILRRRARMDQQRLAQLAQVSRQTVAAAEDDRARTASTNYLLFVVQTNSATPASMAAEAGAAARG